MCSPKEQRPRKLSGRRTVIISKSGEKCINITKALTEGDGYMFNMTEALRYQ
jgi:hypothetical protein